MAIATQSQSQTVLQQIYDNVKNLEGQFPIPVPTVTVDMGTYNPTTGKFNGLVSQLERLDLGEDEGPGPNPKPQAVLVPPEIDVEGVNLRLRFAISTPHGMWKVRANGKEVSGTAAHHSLTIDCGGATSVEWTVSGGGHVYSDRLIAHRSLVVGAGALTIPALPVVLLYEPPPRPASDRSPDNVASYAATTSVGTVLTSSLSSSSSTTTPVPSRFEDVNTMKSVLNGLATAAGAAGNTVAKNALKGIADALGQASATATQGTQVTTEHTLAVVQTFTQATTTGENDGGPGIGDQIQFLLNARLVWLASGGVLRMTLIGHDALVTRSVAALKANRNAEPSGISPAVVDALLALDPFVAGGPQAVLPADRFVHVETYDVNGGDLGISATRTISQTDLQAKTRTDMKVEDMRAGPSRSSGSGCRRPRR